MSAPDPFVAARRAARLQPSILREILKVTERPEVISLAGGLPSPDSFPVEAMREASARVLRDTPREALQYAASEGHGPLRHWLADHLASQGLHVDAAQVLITNGSQQGLDLVGKVLIDPGQRVAVEAPTYLGALQAFAPYEPVFQSMAGDDEGPTLDTQSRGVDERARFAYLVPNFQNPTGRCMSEARRQALVQSAQHVGLPLVEDDPYGELWFDAPPPRSLAARWPEGTIHLGSFSKILAPGLRLGYLVAPRSIGAKLLQAKQAADLHTSGFNQRVALEMLAGGLLSRHLPALRDRYRAQRDAMQAALHRHLAGLCTWAAPAGGMFFWVRLPAGCNAADLLPAAVEQGVAFVPGAAFYASAPRDDFMRLSFVTATPSRIERGIAILADLLRPFGRTAATTGVACEHPTNREGVSP